jgi:hypothetical protein
MKAHILITGAAVAALIAGGASATIHKSHHRSGLMSSGMYAAPSKPIPYAQLDSYLSARPSQRIPMGDSGASMGSGPTPQAADSSMSPPAPSNAEPASGAGDHMGTPNTGAGDMSGSSGAAPATGDTGAATQQPPASPDTTQGSADGSSPPPK